MRKLLLLAALTATAFLSIAADSPEQPPRPNVSPEAEAVLREIAEKHAAVETAAGQVDLKMTQIQGDESQSFSHTLYFRLGKPNRVQVRIKLDTGYFRIACNGEQVWTYYSPTNKYMIEDAPPDLAILFRDRARVGLMMGMGRAVFGPFGIDPYLALTNGTKGVDLAGTEMMAEREVYHLVFHLQLGEMHIWADRETGAIGLARMTVASPQDPTRKVEIEARLQPLETPTAILPAGYEFQMPEDAVAANSMPALMEATLVGDPMKDFQLEALGREEPLHLGALRGRVIALDFWATWCVPCRMEMPVLQKLHDEFEDRGFTVIGVNLMEDREQAQSYTDELGLTFPIVLDKEGTTARDYSVGALPTLILIGRDGVIRSVHKGYRQDIEQTLRLELEELTAEEAPTE